jgi:hypothetical protein
LREFDDKVISGIFGYPSEEVIRDWRKLHNDVTDFMFTKYY